MKQPCVAIAVTGHGFGHSVRCAEVARALLNRGARVVMRTDAPRWLFPAQVEWIDDPGWPLDIGVVQHDGLDMDIDATREAWWQLSTRFEQRAEVEARLLTAAEADVLIGDVPPLAFAAGSKAGIPSFGMTNFTWDWIYSVWPGFEDIVALIQSAYASAESMLRLPLHSTDAEAFAAFRRVEDVPLIARVSTAPRDEVRQRYGLPTEKRVVLLSFGGFTARGLNLQRLASWSEYLFVLTPPIADEPIELPANARVLNPPASDYVCLFAACDAVVTKPGYGIVADALANQVAVLYTDRGPFREYDVLAQALTTLGRARYVPRQAILGGELGPHLDALLGQTSPWAELRLDGADVVAEHVLQSVTMRLRIC